MREKKKAKTTWIKTIDQTEKCKDRRRVTQLVKTGNFDDRSRAQQLLEIDNSDDRSRETQQRRREDGQKLSEGALSEHGSGRSTTLLIEKEN